MARHCDNPPDRPIPRLFATATHCEVLAIGELLVDYIEVEPDNAGGPAQATADSPYSRIEGTLFAQAPGGAPANVAAACATLGVRAGFAGKVGDDERGRFLAEKLAATGVDLAGLIRDPACTTTAAFAHMGTASSELTYSFDRSPGADTMLRADELNAAALSAATVVHVGTFSLTSEPSRTAILAAVDAAHSAGHLVSCDVNLRPHAWPSQSAMLEAAIALTSRSDLIKVSAAELELLCQAESLSIDNAASVGNLADLAAGASVVLSRGPRLIAITCGSGGAYLATRTAHAWTPAVPVAHVADTAGAGDAFWGAALAWLLREGAVLSPASVDCLTSNDLIACGRFACAAASCSIEKHGALGSAPTARQIAERLEHASHLW